MPDLPLSVELRAGAGIPTGDFAGGMAGAEPGLGFGIGAIVRATSTIGVYGGYGWNQFGCGTCGILEQTDDFELDEDVTDTGFDFGAQANFVLGELLVPWLRGGIIYHKLEFSGDDSSFDSEAAIGFEIGAGASYVVVPSLTFTPGIRYRTYTAEFDFADTEFPNRSVNVSYIALDVGLAYRF